MPASLPKPVLALAVFAAGLVLPVLMRAYGTAIANAAYVFCM